MIRQIEPAMVAYLDGKLAANGLAQDAVARKDARLLFRLALEACVGIREKTGNNDGTMVELIQETLGGADGESWCMSFIQTGLAYAEAKTGVRSPIHGSEHCMTVWNETTISQRVAASPLPGAIVIWRKGTTSSGHTGALVTAPSAGWFRAVEGNTEGGVRGGAVVREGGGVYLTERSTRGTGNMKIVGYLKPF